MLDNVPKNANPNMSRTAARQERISKVEGEQCIPLLDLPYSASIRSIKLNSTLKSKKSRNLAESLNDHEQHIYARIHVPETEHEEAEAARADIR